MLLSHRPFLLYCSLLTALILGSSCERTSVKVKIDSKPVVYLPLGGAKLLSANIDETALNWEQSEDGVLLHMPLGLKDKQTVKLHFDSETSENEIGTYTAFLYDNMSSADYLTYPLSYWEENVRYALKARETVPWTVPEREFRHFVLPVRVNNESLDDFRKLYSEELLTRIEGRDLKDAALEINHWCHEMATYKASDSRTSSPLQTISRGLGRCGEESVLAVAALRSVGIPARQVYTPRWAHTDDNHAWVEVYVDGKWWFLGACEPEPELNMAWFNAPVSRAMLLHTKAFGDYYGDEDVIDRTKAYTEINVTRGYVPTRKTEVLVLDEDGKKVKDARVEFGIYNYAEYYTVATYFTDGVHPVSLHTGKGDLMIWASKGDKFGIGKADAEKVRIVLNHRIGERLSLDFDIFPPAEDPIPAVASEEQIAQNAIRLEAENALRESRPKGNDSVLEQFLAENDNSENARALLSSLSAKDRGDVTIEVLRDAMWHCSEKFSRFRDCPRVEQEALLPYFREISEGLKTEGISFSNVQEVAAWVNENIKLDDESNPQQLRIPPVIVWRSRTADSFSKDLFYIALCRTVGFEARLDSVSGKVQEKSLPQGRLSVSYEPVPGISRPQYGRHYSFAKLSDGTMLSVNLRQASRSLLSGEAFSLDEGYYMMTTGVRMADGSVLSHVEFFPIVEGQTANVPIVLRESDENIAVIGNMDAEQLFLKDGQSEQQSILSATGRGFFLLSVMGDKDEPTAHALSELSAASSKIEQWGRPVLVLGKARPLDIKYLISGTDPDNKVLDMLTRACEGSSRQLPVVAICDSFGRIVYFSQGYNTSLSEDLGRVLSKL